MKKLQIMIFALMVICGSAFAATDSPICSKNWETSSQNLRVIDLNDLTENDLNEIKLGNSEIVVAFAAHTTLPISFFLKGNLINLIDNDTNYGLLEIQQTFYARYVEKELILSVDLINWKPFWEFITGSAFVSLNIHDGQLSVIIGAETNLRN